MSSLLGLKIREIRRKSNLSQDRFGNKLGVSGKTISAYETGKTLPPLRILEKISEIYKIPIINESAAKRVEITMQIREIEDLLHSVRRTLDDVLTF
ncbi:helix-turn-helix transcriptional regulator [Patescibacteria group bacterium]